MDAKELIAKIGQKELAAAIGVSENTIRTSVYQGGGQMPASYFDACERLAKAKGEDCPRSLFSFKTAQQDTAA